MYGEFEKIVQCDRQRDRDTKCMLTIWIGINGNRLIERWRNATKCRQPTRKNPNLSKHKMFTKSLAYPKCAFCMYMTETDKYGWQ